MELEAPRGENSPGYPGVFIAHGVRDGLKLGVLACPKSIPGPLIIPGPKTFAISMPCLHFSASNSKSKQPVPILGNCPMMMFSDTPLMGSFSAWDAASMSTSTVSSNEHLISAPVSCLLIP